MPNLQKLDLLNLSEKDSAIVDQGTIEMNQNMITNYLKNQKKNYQMEASAA